MYTLLHSLPAIDFKDIYFSSRHISLPAYLPLCLWFFIAYTNYVWQSTGIMNSSRLVCYLYKNKFIILISVFHFPKACVVQFHSSLPLCWGNLTGNFSVWCEISDVNQHQLNWKRRWITHTWPYCLCTHFYANGQTFSLFRHLFLSYLDVFMKNMSQL